MPHLGYRSRQHVRHELELPSAYFFDLATWHKIALLYSRKTLSGLQDLRAVAEQPALVERLVKVIRAKSGHRLAEDVESAKISLSHGDSSRIRLDYVEDGLEIMVRRDRFELAIRQEEEKLTRCIDECVHLAGIAHDRIDTVFLTGGSTFVPRIRQACISSFPAARIVEGDKLLSVGTGLAIDAAARFGAQTARR
jgi:hypothetical chaperone protein